MSECSNDHQQLAGGLRHVSGTMPNEPPPPNPRDDFPIVRDLHITSSEKDIRQRCIVTSGCSDPKARLGDFSGAVYL